MNERGEATVGDLRALVTWRIQEAQNFCRMGGPGCENAHPDRPCCGAVGWVTFETVEQPPMVMPGRRRSSA